MLHFFVQIPFVAIFLCHFCALPIFCVRVVTMGKVTILCYASIHKRISCGETLEIFNFLAYEWVGWRNDTAGWAGHPLELVFEFDKVRNFSAAHLHTNNLFTKDVQVLHLSLFISMLFIHIHTVSLTLTMSTFLSCDYYPYIITTTPA